MAVFSVTCEHAETINTTPDMAICFEITDILLTLQLIPDNVPHLGLNQNLRPYI